MTIAQRYTRWFGDWRSTINGGHSDIEVENAIVDFEDDCISMRELYEEHYDRPLEFTFEDGSILTLYNPKQIVFSAYAEAR